MYLHRLHKHVRAVIVFLQVLKRKQQQHKQVSDGVLKACDVLYKAQSDKSHVTEQALCSKSLGYSFCMLYFPFK